MATKRQTTRDIAELTVDAFRNDVVTGHAPGTVEELVAEQQTLQARLVQIDGELERARADTSRLVKARGTR